MTDLDSEPGDDRTRFGKIDLPLIRGAFDIDEATTIRTARHRRIQHPIRLTGRDVTMVVAAVTITAFAARPFRLRSRFTLRERGRLPLTRPPRLLQQPFQIGDASITHRDLLNQIDDQSVKVDYTSLQLCDPNLRVHPTNNNRTHARLRGPAIQVRLTFRSRVTFGADVDSYAVLPGGLLTVRRRTVDVFDGATTSSFELGAHEHVRTAGDLIVRYVLDRNTPSVRVEWWPGRVPVIMYEHGPMEQSPRVRSHGDLATVWDPAGRIHVVDLATRTVLSAMRVLR